MIIELSPIGATIFMANTYSQITIHAVFAVKYRENFIPGDWRDSLHQYISGSITGKAAKSFAVGGWKDQVHILFGITLTTCISDLVGAIKASSSGWVNEQRFRKGKVSMAVRLWRLFLCKKPKGCCN